MNAPSWLQQLIGAVTDPSTEPFIPQRLVTPDGMRRSAVLILFGEGEDGPDVLLIQRTAHLRSHAGQPAFPGGGIDADDDGPVGAALREAAEETGLDPSGVDVLAVLPELWVPPSGNAVTPVVAWWREPTKVRPVDVGEVASVTRVPIAALTDPANRLRIRHPSGTHGPAFEVADMLVWGFTAAVLARLLTLAGWERPWDDNRIEDLPEETLRLAMRQRRQQSPQPPARPA